MPLVIHWPSAFNVARSRFSKKTFLPLQRQHGEGRGRAPGDLQHGGHHPDPGRDVEPLRIAGSVGFGEIRILNVEPGNGYLKAFTQKSTLAFL